MDLMDYVFFRDHALESLYKGDLNEAFSNIEGQINFSGQSPLRDRLITLREEYQLLLSYYKQGVNEPERKAQREKLLARAFELSQLIDHRRAMQADDYRAQMHRQAMGDCEERERLLRVLTEETDYETIFNVVWTSHHWDADIEAAATAFLIDKGQPRHRKTVFVAAIMLSLLATFEAKRVEWLVSLLDDTLRSSLYDRVLLALIFVGIHHEKAFSLYPHLTQRIAAQIKDMRCLFLLRALQDHLLAVDETGRFSRRMEREILPLLEEVTQQLKATQSEDEPLKVEISAEANPLSTMMIEVYKMQEIGVDTAYLGFQFVAKRQKFFQHAAHWFGAYEPSHPEIQGSPVDTKVLNIMESNNPCDTERWHMFKLLESYHRMTMAEEEGKTLSRQEALDEIEGESQTDLPLKMPPQLMFEQSETEEEKQEKGLLDTFVAETQKVLREKRKALQGYLQDLYRYFHLFVHRKEEENPFQHNLLLLDNSLFASALNDEEFLQDLVVLCRKLSQHALALSILERLPETVETLDMKARSLLMLRKPEASVEACERLLQLQPDNKKTLEMLCNILPLLGRHEDLLVHQLQLESLVPDDLDVALETGRTFSRLGLYEDALSRIYKVLYHDETHLEARHAAGWALLNLRRWDEAEPFLMGLLDEEDEIIHYIYAGHLHWVRGDVAGAVTLYVEALRKGGETRVADDFFGDDLKCLYQLGITPDDYALMCDLIHAEC